MYTGITQGLFKVIYIKKTDHLLTYSIEFSDELSAGLSVGASVSVDGVCQTVVHISGNHVTFNAVDETCAKTTLSDLKLGQKVSIERSASQNTEIGGHLMSGHIYGTAEVLLIEKWEDNLSMTFQCSNDTMMDYIFEKGYVGINGSSLTVNQVNADENSFSVNLIPHTLSLTDFGSKKPGDKVNIELDASTIAIVEAVKRIDIEKIVLKLLQKDLNLNKT